MKKLFVSWVLLLACVFLIVSGCSDSSEQDENPDGDSIVDGDGTDGDGTEDEPECRFIEDCEQGQDCVNNECVGTDTCRDQYDCRDDQICWYDEDSVNGRCLVYCATDMDCDESGQCIRGLCEKYIGIEEGDPPPKHEDWNGKLHAQFVQDFLEFPMTVTMGGYGLRKGPLGPYQIAMGGSAGIYDRLFVKALTLDDGNDRVTFVSIPMCFPTDYLVMGIVKEVIALGGPDLRHNLVVNASHTHSGPAEYWNLLPGMGFGTLGFSDFSYEMYQRLTKSIAKVVYAAQQELKPAAFGYKINENFDPDDQINADRRSLSGHLKDNRLVVWRIDDMSSGSAEPWVITLNYATHGTVEGQSDTRLTNDSAGGAENMTKLLYEKDHPGKTINTMFFNGMAGNVSPRGGDKGHSHAQRMQVIGTRVYDKVMELFEQIDPSDEIDVKMVSKRVPIDRNYIGYADDEFYSDGVSLFEPKPGGPFRFGAFYCGSSTTEPEENLNIHVYDSSQNLVKEAMDTTSNGKTDKLEDGTEVQWDGEEVIFTASETGKHTILVDGYKGCMSDYVLRITKVNVGSKRGALCLDASCGAICGACPTMKSDLPPLVCNEDTMEENDSSSAAKDLSFTDGSIEVQNLQVCPNDEDWFSFDVVEGEQYSVRVMWHQDDEAYNPETHIKDGNLGCMLNIEIMNHGPMPMFGKTRFTGILLGDLYLAGLPGESSSRMGYDAIEALSAETDFADIVIFGYTNDHHFYISTEQDWMQGGYNTMMSIWGMKFGQFCIDHLKELAIAVSNGTEEETVNEFPQVKPLVYKNLEAPLRVPIKTAKPTETSILIQPVDHRRMQQIATMQWIGADPGVDFPHVYLERENTSGEFEPVLRESGLVYDDRYYEISLTYANESFAYPGIQDADTNNYWTLYWDETTDFPLGTYRFRVEGHYYNGPEDSFDNETGIEAYELLSDPFELLPATIEAQTAKIEEGVFKSFLLYGHPATNDDGESDFERFSPVGTKLHSVEVHPMVGPRLSENVDDSTIAITIFDDQDQEVSTIDSYTLERLESGVVQYPAGRTEGVVFMSNYGGPVTQLSATLPALDAGDYRLHLDMEDSFGNAGEFDYNFTVTVP